MPGSGGKRVEVRRPGETGFRAKILSCKLADPRICLKCGFIMTFIDEDQLKAVQKFLK
jgi:hypothetical protein